MTGFEPAAFCTQNKCATKLRYIPSQANELYSIVKQLYSALEIFI